MPHRQLIDDVAQNKIAAQQPQLLGETFPYLQNAPTALNLNAYQGLI